MKKNGRPKKDRNRVEDRRVPGALISTISDDPLSSRGFPWRYAAVMATAIDPLNEFPEIAKLFGPLMIGFENESDLGAASKFLLRLVSDATPDEADEAFKKIVRLKKNLAGPRDRRTYALMAYSHYIDQTGLEPSKPQLKAYMQARRDIYKDQPGPDEPWTRLWKETGLFGMRER